jgi:ELWxxDGT repeat protein
MRFGKLSLKKSERILLVVFIFLVGLLPLVYLTRLGEQAVFNAPVVAANTTSVLEHGYTIRQVADINQIGLSSGPSSSAVLDGRLYFAANDGIVGRELWMHDPIKDEVTLVADIWPGSFGSGPSDSTVLDGCLYFSAVENDHGRELWMHDPAVPTTIQVADIATVWGRLNSSALISCP